MMIFLGGMQEIHMTLQPSEEMTVEADPFPFLYTQKITNYTGFLTLAFIL